MFKILSAFTFAAVSAAETPGLGISLSQDGMNLAKNIIAPYIFNIVGNVTIPEVDFDGGFLKNVEVELP